MSVKAITAVIASALTIGLTGCVTTQSQQAATPESLESNVKYFTSYDNSHSYAWNIMKLAGQCWAGFERPGITDTYIENDNYESLKKSADPAGTQSIVGNLVIGSTLAASGLLSSWTLPGHDLMFLLSTGKIKYTPIFVGYLPKEEAATEGEAIRKYESNLMNAYSKAAKDLGFTNITVEHASIKAVRPSTNGSIDIRIENGFVTAEEYRKLIGYVWKTTIPEWIDKNQGEAWAFGTFVTMPRLTSGKFRVGDEGGDVFSPNKSIELKLQLLEKMSSYLPDNYFVYVPTYKTRGLKPRFIPHCVASNKAKYYFVMPQSAKKEAAKK